MLTEFHELARIDRQLIGRGGRQGEPGTYEIVASLEDELPRVFAPKFANFLAWTMERGSQAKRDVLPATLANGLQLYAQDQAQRLQYRIRQHTLHLQNERDTQLAFAKPE